MSPYFSPTSFNLFPQQNQMTGYSSSNFSLPSVFGSMFENNLCQQFQTKSLNSPFLNVDLNAASSIANIFSPSIMFAASSINPLGYTVASGSFLTAILGLIGGNPSKQAPAAKDNIDPKMIKAGAEDIKITYEDEDILDRSDNKVYYKKDNDKKANNEKGNDKKVDNKKIKK